MKATSRTPEFDQAIANFETAMTALWLEYYTRMGYLSQLPTFAIEYGRKYAKVFGNKPHGGRDIYCFIEIANGDILKCATFNAPAKHARGNIYNENPVKGCGPHSPDYLK